MIALLSWRVWAGVALAIFLARTHYKAFHAGGASARADLQAYQLEATTAAAAASEAARKKETELNLSVERVKANYAKVKRDNALLSGALDDSLRKLETTISNIRADDPGASSGTNADPRLDIIAECSGAVRSLASAVTELSSQVKGLQDFTRSVRLK